jgi:hypothetical protein
LLCFREKVCDPFFIYNNAAEHWISKHLTFCFVCCIVIKLFCILLQHIAMCMTCFNQKANSFAFYAAYCYVWHALIKKLSNWWIRVHYFWMTYSLSLVKWRVICTIAINLFWNMWQWKKKKISGTYSIESWPYPVLLNFIENVVEILNVSCHNCIFDKDIFFCA